MTTRNYVLVDHTIEVKADLRYVPAWEAKGTITARLAPAGSSDTKFEKQWLGDGLLSELTGNRLMAWDINKHALAREAVEGVV